MLKVFLFDEINIKVL